MNRRLNPLTLLFLLLVYLSSLFSTETGTGYGLHFFAIILAGLFLRVPYVSVIIRIRPIITFLPVMTAIYCLVSLVITPDPPIVIFQLALLALAKIVLMVVGTSIFLELVSSAELIDALRTLWFRLKLKWRPVEDIFQLFDLTLRFFPMVMEEVKALMGMEKALGIETSKSRWSQIKKVAEHLPTLVFICIHRAEQIGLAMEGRGYGKVLPRTVAWPVHFGLWDGIILMVALFFITGRTFIV